MTRFRHLLTVSTIWDNLLLNARGFAISHAEPDLFAEPDTSDATCASGFGWAEGERSPRKVSVGKDQSIKAYADKQRELYLAGLESAKAFASRRSPARDAVSPGVRAGVR